MTFGKPLFGGLLCLAATSGAYASDFSFNGTLNNTGEIQLIEFTSLGGAMTAVTLSYAGGLNSDGMVVPNGGFDPYLWLYDGSGFLVSEDDDGRGVPDPDDFIAFDSLLNENLAPGAYTLALSRFGTYPDGNLSDGFTDTDPFGFFRTRDWDVDIFGVESARLGDVIQAGSSQVPIPASLPSCWRRV